MQFKTIIIKGACMLAAIPWVASAILLERKAVDFDRYCGKDGYQNLVKEAGNLSGKKSKGDKTRLLGTFEYDFSVPDSGWYQVELPHGWAVEYELDKNVYGIANDKLGSFYLAAGKHTLMLRKRNWFSPWGEVEKIVIKSAPAGLAERLRVSGEHFVYEGIIRQGGAYTLNLTAGASKPSVLETLVTDRTSQKVVNRIRTKVPAQDNFQARLAVPAQLPGLFDITFLVDGQPTKVPEFSMAVIDAEPARAEIGVDMRKTLLQEIDCATTSPDYAGGGETRLVQKGFGTYRESGNVSWLTHMNSNEPSWFAYALDIPEANKHYVVEVDYPDDAYRTYAIAVRNAGQAGYPVAGGVETGHDYPLSNEMRTHTLLFWARETDSRLVIANACDGQRGAAAKIRVYRIENQSLPTLVDPRISGRDFANWYEEGSGFVGLFGGDKKKRTASEFIPTAERWAETMAYMGGNVLYPTLMVYQFGLNPSEYNVFATRATTDLAEILLLTAEKYGMRVMFDFHPEARDLQFSADRENASRSRSGALSKRAPMHGPLHPKNQQWLCGLVEEFVARYKHSPAFKGISIRHMKWYNHALNNFHDLDWGYDDYTVRLFENEHGIKIPGINGADDADRFEKRYEYLTNEQNQKKWVQWRCQKIGQLYEKLAGILRRARPDLELESSIFDKEGGVDPALLAKIDNVTLSDGVTYGRRGRGENNRREMLEKMLAPDPNLDMIRSGSAYFEATEVVIPPQQLGFPKGTKANWMSAVVNPSGRLMLERFALAVARVDSKALQDGGNAYTVGQPELRGFMREFRILPNLDFTLVDNASDPVTVRECGAYFYAVNMLPFPVECAISFKGAAHVTSLVDGRTEDVSHLRLAAYELRSFRATASIKDVKVDIPQAELASMESQLAVLKQSLVSVTTQSRASIGELASQCTGLLNAKQYWRFQTTLAVAEPILKSAGILLPDYYNDGFPVTPEHATGASQLKEQAEQNAELLASESIIPDWNAEQVLASKPGQPLKLELTIPATGNYRVKIGTVTGEEFDSFEISSGGKSVGKVMRTGEQVSARDVLFANPVALRSGNVDMRLAPISGKRVGISYLMLTPAYAVIPPMRWLVSENYPKQDFDLVLEPEKTHDFTNWRQLTGFKPFVDISCGVPVQDGTIRYAVTHIYSPDTRRVRLSYGIDYRAKIWLNRHAVKPSGKRRLQGAPTRGEDTLDIDLKEGWNELFLKVSSGSGNNGFWMEISNMDDLKFSTSPVELLKGSVHIPEGGVTLHHQDFEKKVAQTKLTVWDGTGGESYRGKGASQMGNYFAGAKVTGGKTYLLQAYSRGIRDGQGSRIQINWKDAKGKMIKYDLEGKKLTTDWSLLTLKAKAPVSAVSAFLIVGTDKGKEWVDEVWFGEVSE
jgi:hypothetical protein